MSEKLTDAEFAARWGLWRHFLCHGNDHNAIHQQLTDIYWNIGIYRVELATWGYGKVDIPSVPRLFFHHYLHTFSIYLAASIRKITDKGQLFNKKDGKEPDRSVISLWSIGKDMLALNQEYNRKRLFQVQGLQYDVQALERKHQAYVEKMTKSGINRSWVSPKESPEPSRRLHKIWDTLSETRMEDRKEYDSIPGSRLEAILTEITLVKGEIDILTNKFYLHAATPESRASDPRYDEETYIGPSINRLIELSLQCGRIYYKLCDLLLTEVYPLPVYEGDKWDGWKSNQYVNRDELEKIWKQWNEEIKAAIQLREPLLEN